MALADRVLATVRKHGMLPWGGRVLVALSGGSDSVALLHLLCELERTKALVVGGVAHLNHRLRPEADVDEAFCRGMAGALGLPFRVEAVDVGAMARSLRTSIEDAGRRARYDFFARAASDLQVDRIATGHTRDDQAETFLIRLVRGAGLRGLSGVRPKSGRVIRPLIEMDRADLREWLAARDIRFREDATNADRTFTRNRVRHALIPYLQREFSPRITDVLAREAAVAREDDDRLHQEAIDLATSLVLVTEDGRTVRLSRSSLERMLENGTEAPAQESSDRTVEIDAERLTSLHPALASRVARLALAVLAPARVLGFEHVERLLALARNPEGSGVSLPGQQAVRRGRNVVLRRRAFEGFANSFRFSLSIPGEVLLERQGWAISAETAADDYPSGDASAAERRVEVEPNRPGRLSAFSVAVQASQLAFPLAVRSRCPGDRFRPAGLGGHRKKLQDFLVDRKIARETRDLLPLVVDGEDRIVWVVGESVAEDFRVTDKSQGVILLKARRLGGPG